MVKDHTDRERENLLLPHGLLFPISSKGSFICTIPWPLLHQLWSTGSWRHTKPCDIKDCYGTKKIVLFNDVCNTFLFMVIWYWAYHNGPFSKK